MIVKQFSIGFKMLKWIKNERIIRDRNQKYSHHNRHSSLTTLYMLLHCFKNFQCFYVLVIIGYNRLQQLKRIQSQRFSFCIPNCSTIYDCIIKSNHSHSLSFIALIGFNHSLIQKAKQNSQRWLILNDLHIQRLVALSQSI